MPMRTIKRPKQQEEGRTGREERTQTRGDSQLFRGAQPEESVLVGQIIGLRIPASTPKTPRTEHGYLAPLDGPEKDGKGEEREGERRTAQTEPTPGAGSLLV